MAMGLGFEQDGYWNDKICAPGKWDSVKIQAGQIGIAPTPPPLFRTITPPPPCGRVKFRLGT